MKQYEGFKSEASGKKYPMLPAGTYVAGIKNVKLDGQEPDQQLVLRLDVIEGEYAGYYTKRYENDTQNAGVQQQFQAKYKGDLGFRSRTRTTRTAAIRSGISGSSTMRSGASSRAIPDTSGTGTRRN